MSAEFAGYADFPLYWPADCADYQRAANEQDRLFASDKSRRAISQPTGFKVFHGGMLRSRGRLYPTDAELAGHFA